MLVAHLPLVIGLRLFALAGSHRRCMFSVYSTLCGRPIARIKTRLACPSVRPSRTGYQIDQIKFIKNKKTIRPLTLQ